MLRTSLRSVEVTLSLNLNKTMCVVHGATAVCGFVLNGDASRYVPKELVW